ncbi:hypothetical protein [Streptomyces sp. AD55]|uniref:hypothetical protein n=1 Tax=Streptomyces sp. AD55 TaxID=3242895 RepID=UPI003526DCC4
MTAAVPPLGRCALCRFMRALSPHTSRRDRLVRLLCTPCYSHATLVEESGHPVEWDRGHQGDVAEEFRRFLDGQQ